MAHYYPSYWEQVIKYGGTAKCLGVIIDNHLKWQQQIDAVCKSYAAKVKKRKSLEFLPSRILEDIYYKIIISSVIHCFAVWGSSSYAGFKRLERIHARAHSCQSTFMPEHIHARVVRTVKHLDKSPWDDQIVKTASWQIFSYLYKKLMLIIMSNCINERTDKRLNEMIIEHNKRSNTKLTLPRPRTEIGRMTIKLRGKILWNNLSNEGKDINSKGSFKEKMKKLMNNITFGKGTTTTTRFRNEDYVYSFRDSIYYSNLCKYILKIVL